MCRVGALSEPTTSGCFSPTGDLNVVTDPPMTVEPTAVENKNGRTLQGFSTNAQALMLEDCAGCPYATFQKFYDYYGAATYADMWVSGALAATEVTFPNNGDANFGLVNDDATRREAAKKGSAYMSVWMYAIREFEDAIDDCKLDCIDCNYAAAHAWDEGVAFYTGSLEGPSGKSRSGEFGKMVYALAEKRAVNFKTAGVLGKEVDGGAFVNHELFQLFAAGQERLIRGECNAVRPIVARIVHYMTIPLIQGTLRYAYKVGKEGDTSTKSKAEGAVFAAAVLPLVHACSPDDARSIYSYMKIQASSTNWAEVQSAMERNYVCLGIACSEVGGIWDQSLSKYYDNAEPCGDVSFESIAGYVPTSQVTDHNAMDLDQQAMEKALLTGDFDLAQDIYTRGGHSGSYAAFTVPALTAEVPKGTPIRGWSARDTAVEGTAYTTAPEGATMLEVLYRTGDVQATYVMCRVGALSEPTTSGCFSPTRELNVATETPMTVQPSTVENRNGRTLQSFSTNARDEMYDGVDCNGCPYEIFVKYYDYYGTAAYADMWVSGALTGSLVDFPSNGDADFAGVNDIATRREAAKKGSAYMGVWMYVVRYFKNAIDDCLDPPANNNPQLPENFASKHDWDEGVALYTGSLEGQIGKSRYDDYGVMPYSLAEKRAVNFMTAGVLGDDTKGGSQVNHELEMLFQAGKERLERNDCRGVPRVVQRIVQLMSIPLIQGTLRYAYKVGYEDVTSTKDKAEGAVFAASVLPLVHNCSAEDAAIIYDNMRIGADGTNWAVVKAAFERNYVCLGITCSEVGGLVQDGAYKPAAEPCTDGAAQQSSFCPPAAPPAPPASPPDYTIPVRGVQVMSGAGGGEQLFCLRPGLDDDRIQAPFGGVEKNIATQCCVVGSTTVAGCRRFFDSGGDPGSCVSGDARGQNQPTPYTYAAAGERCAALGEENNIALELCDRACPDTGCGYNQYPVYTTRECFVPPPAPPSPPYSPFQIPEEGVAVLSGSTGEQLRCLQPGADDDTTSAIASDSVEKNIAVQCCEEGTSDDAGCKRFIGSDPEDCVAGVPPAAYTYKQAVAICAGRSLGLCDRSCAGTGCKYNQYPVYTNKPCDTSTPIPDLGAAVLDGGTGDQLYCLLPNRDETTTTAPWDGVQKNIATQCCEKGSSDDAGCKRFIGSDPEDCVAGKPPAAKTYAQAAAICDALSGGPLQLGLCDRSCANTGCQYNQAPVFTNKPCAVNPIPEGGVQIVRGDGSGFIQCLEPGKENDVLTSPWPGSEPTDGIRNVAIQCCVSGSTTGAGCRRFTGTQSVNTCVAGLDNEGGIKPFTYNDAVAKCRTLGSEVGEDLELCSQSCAGFGCSYKRLLSAGRWDQRWARTWNCAASRAQASAALTTKNPF
eukprot:CAMPEP_0183378274 /NCGR_PEP_ID=MMETSP0164_2-20130417/124826_1 /TAXON_ID=221442 /ORGANISM="Coccolithus pelagicus ssp braarudi, Strain PLY182g" /LENGTH=1381 /DNA_ID=CAMNT_0025555825 /DNA_START=15 /DNA_END=4160 /DNA_ORIENTATION=+